MNFFILVIRVIEKTRNYLFSKILLLTLLVRNTFVLKESARQYIYLLQDTYKAPDGNQIITAKIIDSPRGFFKMPALELVGKRKDCLATTIIAGQRQL